MQTQFAAFSNCEAMRVSSLQWVNFRCRNELPAEVSKGRGALLRVLGRAQQERL